jgi:hypothetical protein
MNFPNHLTAPPKPLLFTDPMPLYLTAGSLEEVVSLGESQLPIMDRNKLFTLLMTYHNTLLMLKERERVN